MAWNYNIHCWPHKYHYICVLCALNGRSYNDFTGKYRPLRQTKSTWNMHGTVFCYIFRLFILLSIKPHRKQICQIQMHCPSSPSSVFYSSQVLSWGSFSGVCVPSTAVCCRTKQVSSSTTTIWMDFKAYMRASISTPLMEMRLDFKLY